MTAIPFPALRPTSRSYSPGSFPTTEFKALNGASTRVLYGNRRSDAELSLSFANVTDTQAAAVLAHYERITPTDDWTSFTTADGALGAAAPLAVYLQEVGGSGLRWRYAEPPAITSVQPGISTVQVSMVGQLDAA
jgi:hypothetical protein